MRAYEQWNPYAAMARLSGDRETLRVIIEMVLGQTSSLLEPLEADEADGGALHTAAHTLKNIGGVLDAAEVVRRAAAMQCAIQKGLEVTPAARLALARCVRLLMHEIVHFHDAEYVTTEEVVATAPLQAGTCLSPAC